eukprot:jgi/Chlat1/177/Chrsp1S03253
MVSRRNSTRSGQRAPLPSSRMYSDSPSQGTKGKPAVFKRLGTAMKASAHFKGAAARQAAAAAYSEPRTRAGPDGKWEHDMYDDHQMRDVKKTRSGKQQRSSYDLRQRLRSAAGAAPSTTRSTITTAGNKGVRDLRQVLARHDASQTTATATARSAKDVAAPSSTLRPTSTAVTRPATVVETAAPRAAVTQKAPVSAAVQSKTRGVADLLQVLNLGKYLPLFQQEEIDMAALRQMQDVDLKELGVPMGPRKKILAAVGR